MILAAITTPHVDWLALSPALALLAAAAICLLGAVLVPSRGAPHLLGHDRRRRLHHLRRPRRRRLRPLPATDAPDRRVDEPRPPRRAHPGARRRLRPRGGARLLGRPAARPRRRVLRAARRCGWRHGVLRLRREPDDPVPRARVVLDLALHPGRARHPPQGVARGRAQVPDRRKLRLGDPAVRLGADLRRHRRARLQRDPHRNGRRRLALRGGDGDDHRRARVQGVRGSVPHVDARRLRGRAHAGDRLHVGRDQGGRPRRDAADPRDGVPGAVRDLVDRDRGARRDLARDRQLRRPGATERQAPARLLLRLAGRLHADRDRRRQRARRQGAALLPDPLRRGLDRRLRRRRSAGARARAAR